jgi:ATP-dependent Clp protease ATP-binding subunit ClpB
MSEFGEKFNSSKLIGAPAGYVGYKESGQLTEKVKHHPHSLVLFDEIEKANPEIFDLLLQILEDGYLTDGAGAKIDFSHTAIIMTSNLGSEFYNGRTAIGFDGKNSDGLLNQKISESIKKWFKPEFLNRLDQVIFFNQLDEPALKAIADKQLRELSQKLASEKSLAITHDDNLLDLIISHAGKSTAIAENKGARGIRQAISEIVEDALAEAIISGRLKKSPNNKNKAWRLKAKNGIITLT